MKLPAKMTAVLLVCSFAGAVAAAPSERSEDELQDRFEHRWFDIEIIVFERLPVLDATTSERLTHTRQRMWPGTLLESGPLSQPTNRPFDYATEYCYDSGQDESQLARQLGLQRSIFSDLTSADRTRPREPEIDMRNDAALQTSEQSADTTGYSDQPPLVPGPSELFDALVADYEQQLLNESYQWRDDLTLSDAVKSINRQRDLRPVMHLRWRQPVPDRSQPAPLWVRAPITPRAPATSAGLSKIEGYIAITVGRYLHFAPTLWYNSDTAGMVPVPFPPPPVMQPTKTLPGYMELAESRRMRSEEMHYLDHPKFGVIVRIDPIPIPQHIQLAWDQLHEEPPDSLTDGAAELSN